MPQLDCSHHYINLQNSPIHGCHERLVQKALDSLANDTTVAKLCNRYDLAIMDLEPGIRNILEELGHEEEEREV